jgi:carbamoyltransferase
MRTFINQTSSVINSLRKQIKSYLMKPNLKEEDQKNVEDKNNDLLIIGNANTFHDPAIAIIKNNFIFAEALERESQLKRAICMPFYFYSIKSIKNIIKEITKKDDPLKIILRTTWNIPFLVELKLGVIALLRGIKRKWTSRKDKEETMPPLAPTLIFIQGWFLWTKKFLKPFIKDLFQNSVSSVIIKCTPHHLAHAANAVYTSPFSECVVMILDGHGGEECCTFYHFKENNFKLLSKSNNSLGFVYDTITACCGFSPIRGDEWKVMGLSPYGKFCPEIYNFFMENTFIDGLEIKFSKKLKAIEEFSVFNFFNESSLRSQLTSKLNHSLRELDEIVGGFREPDDEDYMKSADLAFNLQKYFSDVVFKLADKVSQVGLSQNLAFAGGCALNSSTNGQILQNSNFQSLHVPFAPGDDGNAIGASLYEKYFHQNENRLLKILSPYLGSEININNLERILSFQGIKFKKIDNQDSLIQEIAGLLSEGAIIGWMQGRSEFGPRALGNRSILADPRIKDMKDKVNALVKFREAYRPLAPSILHEYGPVFFENYQESPYMERTLTFKPQMQEKVPAVFHVNGTGRLQTVKEEWNPLFYKLIKEFKRITGIPMVLNTSLNVRGKPIVHSEEDALTLFFTTGLKNLVIGPYLIQK